MSVRALIVGKAVPTTRALIELLSEKYDVTVAHTGTQALRSSSALVGPSIVLIVGDLSDVAGTELCRQLRLGEWTSKLPVVVLSEQNANIERVVAFELGADDYIVVPFDERELLLRLSAILRRSSPNQGGAVEISAGPLILDRTGYRVHLNGAPLSLTKVEFQLLEVLMTRRGRDQPRKQLLEDVWGRSAEGSLRTVDTHIRRLRTKLGNAARYVQTVRGVGYRFGDPSELDD